MTTLNGVLIAMVFVATLAVMVGWHVSGRGAWHGYVAGRAIMALLVIIAAITGLAAVTMLVGPWPGMAVVYGALYALLLAAIVQVGVAVITTHRDRPKEKP